MIKLVQFFPIWDLPNASPFCLKVETYLRMAQIAYESEYTVDPRISSTGKFPMIRDGEAQIPDSSLIIDYLKSKYGDSLDKHLTDKEQGQALALQRLFEEHLYWIGVYSRWIDPTGWPIARRAYFGSMPLLLRGWMPGVIRKKILRQLVGHGMGLHNQETIYAFGIKDIQAVASILAENKFMLGDKPSSIDAVAYGFLANIIYVPIESPLKQAALQHENLVTYCDRIRDAYFK